MKLLLRVCERICNGYWAIAGVGFVAFFLAITVGLCFICVRDGPGSLLRLFTAESFSDDESAEDWNASVMAFHSAGGATLTKAEWDWCDRALDEAWKQELAWQESPEGRRYHEHELDALSLAVKSGDWNEVDALGTTHGGGIGLVHAISLMTAWKRGHKSIPPDLSAAVKECGHSVGIREFPDGSLEGPKLPDGANVLAQLYGRDISRKRLGEAAYNGQASR